MPASCALPVTAELIARQNLPGGAKRFLSNVESFDLCLAA